MIYAISVDPSAVIKPKDSNFTFNLDSIKLPTVNLNDILKLYDNLRPQQSGDSNNNHQKQLNYNEKENNDYWIVGKLKNIQWRPPTINTIQNVKMPWDKYYRGEIPFFENINLNEKIGRRDDVVAEIMVEELDNRKTDTVSSLRRTMVLTHSPTYLLTYSLTHLLTHLLTYSPTHSRRA